MTVIDYVQTYRLCELASCGKGIHVGTAAVLDGYRMYHPACWEEIVAITPKMRTLVRERDCHRCVRCGEYVGPFGDYSIHHRRPRGMGGTKIPDSPANLLLLCGSGTTGCHGHLESHRTEAEDRGYIVRHTLAAVADIPVETYAGRRIFTTEGTVEDAA